MYLPTNFCTPHGLRAQKLGPRPWIWCWVDSPSRPQPTPCANACSFIRSGWMVMHSSSKQKPSKNFLDGYTYHALVKWKRDKGGDGAAAVTAATAIWSYVHLQFGPSLIRHIKSKGVIEWSIQGRLAHIRYCSHVYFPFLHIFGSCFHYI